MVFIVRQPIHDRQAHLYGYELCGQGACKHLVSARLDSEGAGVKKVGPSQLVSKMGIKVFVSFDPDIEFSNEILGSTSPPIVFIFGKDPDEWPESDQLTALKKAGNFLAFSGLEHLFSGDPIVAAMDYLVLDVAESRVLDETLLEKAHYLDLKIMLCGVETRTQFELGVKSGAELFKGDYFKIPELLDDGPLPTNHITYFQLLKEIRQPNIKFHHLEQIIERDATLMFKLMQFINSAHFGTRYRIRTIKHGLSLLGEQEIQKWATMVLIGLLARHRPEELLTTALVRARFCEEMATKTGQEALKQESFFLGMISILDALLNRPIDSILKQLPISSMIAEALLGSTQNQLALLLQLIIEYERANWFRLTETAHRLKVDEETVVTHYFNAVEFASQDLVF